MLGNRFLCKRRARWLVSTAARPVRRDRQLIGPYRSESQGSHLATSLRWSKIPARTMSRFNDSFSSWYFAFAARFLAISVISQPSTTQDSVTAPRSRRLIRFRVTAFPTRRPTTNPYLVRGMPFLRAASTSRSSAQLRPTLLTIAKSLDFLKRRSLSTLEH